MVGLAPMAMLANQLRTDQPPPANHNKVDLLIVVTSAALLVFESAQIEAIKVGL